MKALFATVIICGVLCHCNRVTEPTFDDVRLPIALDFATISPVTTSSVVLQIDQDENFKLQFIGSGDDGPSFINPDYRKAVTALQEARIGEVFLFIDRRSSAKPINHVHRLLTEANVKLFHYAVIDPDNADSKDARPGSLYFWVFPLDRKIQIKEL